MKQILLVISCLAILLVPLLGEELPSFNTVAETSIHPLLVIRVQDNTIVYANPAASILFSVPNERLNGRDFPALIKQNSKDILELNAKVLPFGESGKAPKFFQVGVQKVVFQGTSYYVVLLQERTQQETLLMRNRVLSIAFTTILVIALLFAAVFMYLQVSLLKQLRKEQNLQKYYVQLLQEFLDADERISYVKDTEGRFLFSNASLEHFLQKNAMEIRGKRISEIASPAITELIEENDKSVINEIATKVYEQHWEGKTYTITKFPLTLPDGQIGLGAFVQNITEQRKQEETLKKGLRRSAMLAQILSSSFERPQEQLKAALRKANELTESSISFLLAFKPETQTLCLSASSQEAVLPSLDEQMSARFESHYLPPCAKIENSGPITSPFQTLSEAFQEPFDTALTVPFFVEEQLTGIVVLANSPHGYDENDQYQIQLLFAGIWTSMLKIQKEAELQASQQSLRLLLDSTAEGIFGVDRQGLCTFCNASCLQLLGYENESELLGKNMHALIHHSTRNNLSISEEECQIRTSLTSGKGIVMENEVFWEKDGNFFDVLCYSYPQIKEGEIVGAVITFTNNTERKANLKKIEYLNFHDQLTGLYNRAYFDEKILSLDHKRNLPLSIIVGDVNGLKLSNDIFGHLAGDRLLIDIADILKRSCRDNDVISRIGGDEFVILLSNTNEATCSSIVKRIQHNLDQSTIMAGSRSIALGQATKVDQEQKILDMFDLAEDRMYRQKTLRRNETEHKQLEVLIAMLFSKAPKEEHHALQVQKHATTIAGLLHLNSEDSYLASRAGYYHDIGKVVLSSSLINSKTRDTTMQRTYQEHVSAGYRILNTFEETMDLAPYVLNHHEWWDGNGYLKGLKGEEIPYISRILRLSEVWEREHLDVVSTEEKKRILTNLSGKEVDPNLVNQILQAL